MSQPPRVVAGVDVGLTGGLAFMDEYGRVLAVHKMPVTSYDAQNSKKSIADSLQMKLWFEQWKPVIVMIERQRGMPGQGSVATHVAGMQYGAVISAARDACRSIELVEPLSWKKAVFETVEKNKTQSQELATEKWGEWKPGKGKLMPSGMADALWIAVYATQTLKQ
jgi:Holliday junction resolvasome RuvABC endonuclease subunit